MASLLLLRSKGFCPNLSHSTLQIGGNKSFNLRFQNLHTKRINPNFVQSSQQRLISAKLGSARSFSNHAVKTEEHKVRDFLSTLSHSKRLPLRNLQMMYQKTKKLKSHHLLPVLLDLTTTNFRLGNCKNTRRIHLAKRRSRSQNSCTNSCQSFNWLKSNTFHPQFTQPSGSQCPSSNSFQINCWCTQHQRRCNDSDSCRFTSRM